MPRCGRWTRVGDAPQYCATRLIQCDASRSSDPIRRRWQRRKNQSMSAGGLTGFRACRRRAGLNRQTDGQSGLLRRRNVHKAGFELWCRGSALSPGVNESQPSNEWPK
ncbi:hypothetical protein CABS03_01532 [Colletotrichum abscissum]|uniref:Uncharacterized protein n=1 Tax=Colletotrichum abscissum TaxID=1671311 RepID=A0A9P9XFY2_9PEZI|nr:hypothetical protein CABS02_07361 [Colletotrichum abscissum]